MLRLTLVNMVDGASLGSPSPAARGSGVVEPATFLTVGLAAGLSMTASIPRRDDPLRHGWGEDGALDAINADAQTIESQEGGASLRATR